MWFDYRWYGTRLVHTLNCKTCDNCLENLESCIYHVITQSFSCKFGVKQTAVIQLLWRLKIKHSKDVIKPKKNFFNSALKAFCHSRCGVEMVFWYISMLTKQVILGLILAVEGFFHQAVKMHIHKIVTY